MWLNGEADFMVADATSREVVLEEHPEITADVGLDDVEATVRGCIQSMGE